jgi:hypothetical protein
VRNSNGRLTANSGREPREKVTILRKKFSLPIGLAARRIEVYEIGNNATLAGYANTTEIPVPAAGWGATQELRELVRR